MNVTQTSKSRAGKAASALLDSVSLYLHIPFCHVKCHYCDFTSYAGVLRLREPFVAALRDEIAYAGRQACREDGQKRRCRTIFFGGGTPSLLSAEQVALLLATARDAFDVDPDAEISLEANPGALEYGHLDELRSLGVNRLSMGAQSFDAALLRWMGVSTRRRMSSAPLGRRVRQASTTSISTSCMPCLGKRWKAGSRRWSARWIWSQIISHSTR